MTASSYPMLSLICGLAALAVAGSALLVRSQIAEPRGKAADTHGGLSPTLARKLSLYLFCMAALMVVQALVLELGDAISGLVGFSSAYICDAVLALGFGLISVMMRHSYRNLQRGNGDE